jgi:hypothetical protein
VQHKCHQNNEFDFMCTGHKSRSFRLASKVSISSTMWYFEGVKVPPGLLTGWRAHSQKYRVFKRT